MDHTTSYSIGNKYSHDDCDLHFWRALEVLITFSFRITVTVDLVADLGEVTKNLNEFCVFQQL